MTLIDTADAYALGARDFGHGEASWPARWRPTAAPRTTVDRGHQGRPHAHHDGAGRDGRPEHLHAAARARCAARRRGDRPLPVPPSRPRRPLRRVARRAARPRSTTGSCALAGISNADDAQIQLSQDIVGDAFVAVQNQFSPAFRSARASCASAPRPGPRLPAVEPAGRHRLGVGGSATSTRLRRDRRRHEASPQQVALAWMLAKGPNVSPSRARRRPADDRLVCRGGGAASSRRR